MSDTLAAYHSARASALREVLALIDKGLIPTMFEGTPGMRGAAAALNGLRADVKRLIEAETALVAAVERVEGGRP